MENPDTVFGERNDISSQTFDAFLSNCWPWQQRKLQVFWNSYQNAQDIKTKVPILKELLKITQQLSGHA
jgi:hypothetical protein